MKNNRRIPLELYVHIPFCVRKCQYCDFLSGPSDEETKDRYIEALLKEIRAAEHTEDYEIVSVFIGGGTLKAEAIASIMRTLQEQFFFCEDAEVTIEANPGTVDLEKLTIYRNVGINRLSLGLQSTDAEELKLLGRIHPGAIVLLHSTSKTNGEILDELLTKWEEMGYTFKPLSEI